MIKLIISKKFKLLYEILKIIYDLQHVLLKVINVQLR